MRNGSSGARTDRDRGPAFSTETLAFLKFKQLYAGRSDDLALATSPRVYAELIRVFRAVMPLVTVLNEPLVGAHRVPPADRVPVLPGLRDARGRRGGGTR